MVVTVGGVDVSANVENNGISWTPRNTIRSVTALDQHVYAKTIATKWDLSINLRNLTMAQVQAITAVVAGQNYVTIVTDTDPVNSGEYSRTYYDVTVTASVSYVLNGVTYLDAPVISAKEA